MSTDVNSLNAWRLIETLPSVSGSGESCIDKVINELESRGWSASDQFAMRLALSEAFENAVEHGNKKDSSKNVHLSVVVDDNRALATIRDEGPGFQYDATPNPTLDENLASVCGRGLFLIKNFMTNVWHNEAGNVIYMEKVPTPSEKEKLETKA